jgi:CheY-like chemotaxis protein/CHASE3 domain sensor protein/putative methionine-R-sulfoxide reductase with GAF domain
MSHFGSFTVKERATSPFYYRHVKDISMKLRTQLLFGFGLVLVLMTLMATVSYHSNQYLLKAHQQVGIVHELISTGRLVHRSLIDMQSAMRGFLITGDDRYLQPFETGEQAYQRAIRELKDFSSGNIRQIERLEEVESLVGRWVATVALPGIEERRQVTRGESTLDALAESFMEEDQGRLLFMNIRSQMNDFIDVENGKLNEYQQAALRASRRAFFTIISFTVLAIALGIGAAIYVTAKVSRQVGGEPAEIAAITEQIAGGNLNIEVDSGSGIKYSVSKMLIALQENQHETQRQDWLKTGIAKINEDISGDPELQSLASKAISQIAGYLNAPMAAFYVEENNILTLQGSYAYKKRDGLFPAFKIGEGLLGQAAQQKRQILIDDIPNDYFQVTCAFGERIPRLVCVTPILYEGRLKGVVEVGSLHSISDQHMEYLKQAMPILGVAVESAQRRAQLTRTLKESQQLTEELQVQQEELRVANEELEQQAQQLKESEERLKVQQEELEVINADLEEKNELLEQQKEEVEKARTEIGEKAKELALSSKYKSEFMANMSHELRTPLNSLLLLSQDLAYNKEGNLTAQQMEAAKIIHSSGSDLLNLINEILDLSKIESGRMDLHAGRVQISDIAVGIRSSFEHVAAKKGLGLDVVISKNSPSEITSDRKRVEQVLRNLLSNAIKFTDQGNIKVTFCRPDPKADLSRSELSADKCLSISVQDTGIGIAPEHQKIIFKAFQQADSGTARKYGGTGLGLSISREFMLLLGGELQVESEKGKGSTFTAYFPIDRMDAVKDWKTIGRLNASPPRISRYQENNFVQIKDDRENLKSDDRAVIIIEDDPKFARLLVEKCNEKGFKCLAAGTGEAGLELATKHLPHAILLDINLPDMNGFTVLTELKENTATRHIPVHIISVEERSTAALQSGAVGHAVKPINQENIEEIFQRLEKAAVGQPKRVLVVEDDPHLRLEIVKMIADKDVTVQQADSGKQAMEALQNGEYDCMVLDLGLPDMNGYELLSLLHRKGIELPPVVVHTSHDLTTDEELSLREHAESIVIKDVRSQERLLDEVSLFLHRIVNKMPEKKRKVICNLHDSEAILKGKKVLIVDDDMRTTFTLAHLLSERGMETLKAENGERALRLLEEHPDTDIALMDIMMPGMDGYETMNRIRAQNKFRKLPIIVLTAKAMPEDRQKCLEAGANDYLSKPLDQQRLLSMLRVWLHR